MADVNNCATGGETPLYALDQMNPDDLRAEDDGQE